MMTPVKTARGVEDLYDYLGIDDAEYKMMTVDARDAVQAIYEEFTGWSTREKCEYFLPLSDDEQRVIVQRYADRIWDDSGNLLLDLSNVNDDEDWQCISFDSYLQKQSDLAMNGYEVTEDGPVFCRNYYWFKTYVTDVNTGDTYLVFVQRMPSFSSVENTSFYVNRENLACLELLAAIDMIRSVLS